MSLSEAQVSGESENVAEAILKASEALEKLGVDAAEMAARIKELKDAAAKANAEQEELKRKLKAQTVVVEASYHKLHVTTSGYLDVVIAAVDKDSDEAANFRRIRSRITRPDATPQPLPVPGLERKA